jgi:ATP/maltotriose-dependent transcriptional regulator MalT
MNETSREFLARGSIGAAFGGLGRGTVEGNLPVLTPRESQVLKFLATGGSYVEIGRELKIELNTVRTHIRSLYDKLGVINRAEAVNLGWSFGLLQHGR